MYILYSMKKLIKKILPEFLVDILRAYAAFVIWKKNNFTENAPQYIKEKIFLKYGILDAPWIETGTYYGTTTDFLNKQFSSDIHTIEPSKYYYDKAVINFRKNRKIILYHGKSEKVLPQLLLNLKKEGVKKINFWLDGHYSGGQTFKGEKEYPLEEELLAIENYLPSYEKITILIDDIRLLLPHSINFRNDYPSVDILVDWSRKNNFSWRIEHDIFVMQNN